MVVTRLCADKRPVTRRRILLQDAHGPGQADAGRDRVALGGALGDRRRVPLRARQPIDPRSSRSTRHRRRCPAPSTWAPSSATARPMRWPATSGCAAAPSTTRWAGTTTGWPPSGGCRTTTACAATRRSRTRPSSRRHSAATHRRTTRAVPISRPNFVELCHELTAIDEAAFEELFRRLGLSVDWTLLYTTIDDLSRRTSQVDVPPQPRPRRGLQRRGTDACGTSTTARPSRRPRSRTGSGRVPTTSSPSTARTATC